MTNLRDRGFIETIQRDVVDAGVPLLGLCLGMQLLATRSEEHGTQQIRRKWKGNSITCQGLAWTLANAADDDREGRSGDRPPGDG